MSSKIKSSKKPSRDHFAFDPPSSPAKIGLLIVFIQKHFLLFTKEVNLDYKYAWAIVEDPAPQKWAGDHF